MSVLTPSSDRHRNPSGTDRRMWWGLAVLTLPVLLVSMDFSVLYLAIPAITDALAPTAAQQLWILDIYGFLIAGLLITMGNVGDRIGRRRVLLIGAGMFGVASVVAAFAPNAAVLIAARALMGVGGATLMPSSLSLIANSAWPTDWVAPGPWPVPRGYVPAPRATQSHIFGNDYVRAS